MTTTEPVDLEDWTCGDCGTTWPSTVWSCENVEQDRAAVTAAHAALPESRRVGL